MVIRINEEGYDKIQWIVNGYFDDYFHSILASLQHLRIKKKFNSFAFRFIYGKLRCCVNEWRKCVDIPTKFCNTRGLVSCPFDRPVCFMYGERLEIVLKLLLILTLLWVVLKVSRKFSIIIPLSKSIFVLIRFNRKTETNTKT